MKLQKVQEILAAKRAWEAEDAADCWNREVYVCQASDLMSDVLDFRKSRSLLLTGLTNVQVVRTAEVADIAAICLVRDKRPPPETIHLAHEKAIPLLLTSLTMFESCGRLYAKGLRGEAQKEVTVDCQKPE